MAVLNIIEGSVDTLQGNEYHPEGDVRNHTLQVFNHAVRESNDVDLVMAALTHDIGKTECDGPGHEDYSSNILSRESIFSEKTIWLVYNHMRIRTYIEGEMKGLKKVIQLSNNSWFADLVKLSRWDNMGRNPNRKMKFDRVDILDRLNNCENKKFNF